MSVIIPITDEIAADWCHPVTGYAGFNGVDVKSTVKRVYIGPEKRLGFIKNRSFEPTPISYTINAKPSEIAMGPTLYPIWHSWSADMFYVDVPSVLLENDFSLEELAAGAALIEELQRD